MTDIKDGMKIELQLSLRDYFAAHALNGMLASCDDYSNFRPRDAAQKAFIIADAMIAERNK